MEDHIRIKVTILIFLIFVFTYLLGHGDITNPKVKSYELDVSFNPEKSFIKGKATVEFEPNGYKKIIFFLMVNYQWILSFTRIIK